MRLSEVRVCCRYLLSHTTAGLSSACGRKIPAAFRRYAKQTRAEGHSVEEEGSYLWSTCLFKLCRLQQVARNSRHGPLFQNIRLQRRPHPCLIQTCWDKRWTLPCCKGLFTCKRQEWGVEGGAEGARSRAPSRKMSQGITCPSIAVSKKPKNQTFLSMAEKIKGRLDGGRRSCCWKEQLKSFSRAAFS